MITEFSARVGIPVSEILGRGRVQPVNDARHLYWKLLRDRRGFSYTQLAKLNERTPASILHGVKTANDKLSVGDKVVCEMWDKVKDIF